MDHHLPTTTQAFPAPTGWRLLIFQGLSAMAYLIPGYDPAVLHPPSGSDPSLSPPPTSTAPRTWTQSVMDLCADANGPAPGGLTERSHGA